jgi:SAM-dependent methyltransferase
MSYVQLVMPGDPRFRAALASVRDGRADLQRCYPDAEHPEYLRWAATSGLLEYPELLGPFFPPVPPEELRAFGCGGHAAHSHLYSSLQDFEAVVEAWETFTGRGPETIERVLDFGAGCGRVMRWWSTLLPAGACLGSDVNHRGIAWCRAHLRGDYQVNQVQPPLSVPDRSCDLVYSLSVFSHLNEQSCLSWIRELARVCKPDGRIVLSTCGMFSLSVIARSPEHQAFYAMDRATALRHMREFERTQFLYYCERRDVRERLLGVEDDYGHTFLESPYVRRAWHDVVELLGLVPGRLSLFQDLIVLRPRA